MFKTTKQNTDNIITKQTVFLCCKIGIIELIMMFDLPIAQPREVADSLSCIADLNECCTVFIRGNSSVAKPAKVRAESSLSWYIVNRCV